jgi:hypothetical protein
MKRLLLILMAGISATAADKASTPTPLEQNALKQLLEIRRVYVDRLTGGETAAQMRDILLSSLESSKLFVLTENPERADATLKGAAEDMVFTEVHTSSESLNARANVSAGRSNSSSRGAYGGIGVGESENDHSAERRHEAIAAVRLVNKEGDVIWATTQESLGAKFRGASTDVADKITARLKEDFERARRLATSTMQVVPLSGAAPNELGQIPLKKEPGSN